MIERRERGEADGAATCTYFYLDADQQRVVLVPLEGVVPDETAPYMILARDLDAALDEACLAVEEAADVARSLAGAVGLIEGQGLVVHEHVDDQAPCTRGDVNAFGRVEVTVRGPAATD